jgi:uncharacterized membrane protein
MGIKFIIYGLIGWIMEVIWTGSGSLLTMDFSLTSHTSLWMLFIYGCAVLLEPVHNKIRSVNWFLRGMLYMILIFSIEYISGWLLREIIGVCPWDYSQNTYNIDGLIRLDYAPAWFFAGLLFERMHDFLDKILKLYRRTLNGF